MVAMTMGNGRGKVKLGKDEDICIVTTNAKAQSRKGGNGRIRGHGGMSRMELFLVKLCGSRL